MSCEACHSSHAKCELKTEKKKNAAALAAGEIVVTEDYDQNAKSGKNKTKACARCLRMGLICVPRRPRKRGRPRSAVSNTLDKRRIVDKKTRGLTDCAKWTECEAFLPQTDSLAQYQAAAAMVSLTHELGLKTPPRTLYWAVRLLAEVSQYTESVALLHAATTLAVSAGFENISELFAKPSALAVERPLSYKAQEAVNRLQGMFAKDVPGQAPEERDCAYMVVVTGGRMQCWAGSNFADLCLSTEKMYEMAKARPGHYKFWLETVVSDADKARFVKGCLSVFLTAPVVLDESGVEDYCSFGGVLKSIRVKDRAGAQWLVDLEERDVQICGPPGSSAFYNCVRLFNFRRLDSKGNRILSAVAPKSLVESKMDIKVEKIPHNSMQQTCVPPSIPCNKLPAPDSCSKYQHTSDGVEDLLLPLAEDGAYDWPDVLEPLDSQGLLETFNSVQNELGMFGSVPMET